MTVCTPDLQLWRGAEHAYNIGDIERSSRPWNIPSWSENIHFLTRPFGAELWTFRDFRKEIRQVTQQYDPSFVRGG